jgi:hypothetical protein
LNVIEGALYLSKISIKSLPIVGFALDTFVNLYDKASGKISSAKAFVNIAIGAVVAATLSIPVIVAATAYAIIDKVHPRGIEGALEDKAKLENENRKILGKHYRFKDIY